MRDLLTRLRAGVATDEQDSSGVQAPPHVRSDSRGRGEAAGLCE